MTRARRAALAVAAILACGCLAACTAQAADPAPTSTPEAHVLIDQDFPDPGVIADGGTYYAFATNSPGFNVQRATSTDLRHWTVDVADALPELPAWAQRGATWAPAVAKFGAQYLMFYVARDAASQRQCIGLAAAATAAGPYAPVGDTPFVCDVAEGGDIDPYVFTDDDDGARYLLWKGDGNCCGLDTWIQVAPLAADGRSLTGAPTRLIKQDQSWEGHVVEAPVLVKHAGEYVLLYSANDYGGDAYAIGWASSSSLTGPFAKHPQPLLSTASSGGRYRGPGGEDVVTKPDGTQLLVFHAWDPAYVYRGMDALSLTWSNGAPKLATN